MTTKVTTAKNKTTLCIECPNSDINIVLITENGMLTGVNYWMGVGMDEDMFTHYNRADERLSRFVIPRVFKQFDTEFILPHPEFDNIVECIDDAIWAYQERENDTIALNSIGHWLLGSAMYPMYKSDSGLILRCDYNDDERIHLDEITHWAFDQLSTRDWERICEQATPSATHRIEHLIYVGRVKPIDKPSGAESITLTIPEDQLAIMRNALLEHLATMERMLKCPTESQAHEMFDLRQLASLMKYDVKVTLSGRQADNFCGDNGIDLPQYN